MAAFVDIMFLMGISSAYILLVEGNPHMMASSIVSVPISLLCVIYIFSFFPGDGDDYKNMNFPLNHHFFLLFIH